MGECFVKPLLNCLIISLLTLLSLNLSGQTDAYSKPAGFVRKEVPAGTQRLSSTPFTPFDGSLNSLLDNQLTGEDNDDDADKIIKWDATSQAYTSAFKADNTSDVNKDGKWFVDDVNWVATSLTLAPGEGFWIQNQHAAAQNVFLMGKLVLDSSKSITLSENMNLFAYPFTSKINLNDSDLKNDGAHGAATQTGGPDVISKTNSDADFWLLDDSSDPNDGKWLDESNVLATESLKLGIGYWYNRQGTGSFTWTENLPYTDEFNVSATAPEITGMSINSSLDEITLTISCTGDSGETLMILYKDLTVDDSLTTGSGWSVAATGIATNSSTSVTWTDSGETSPAAPVVARDAITVPYIRIYMVARQDIDTDSDGLCDGIEKFTYGTSETDSDSDDDGMPDGWEIQYGLDPTTDDASGDADSDGLTNLQEYNSIDSYTTLLLHCDGNDSSTVFAEETGKTVTVSGNAQISTSTPRFGTGTAIFSGENDYLSLAASDDFNFGTDDFTIEFWMKTTQTSPYYTMAKFGTQGVNNINFLYCSGGYDYYLYFAGTGSACCIQGANSSIYDGDYHHHVLSRADGTLRYFIDGILQGSVSCSVNLSNSTVAPYFGKFSGTLDEIRVSKGIARWTSAFTPPQVPYYIPSDPTDSDSDDDGMPDGWEVNNGLDPNIDDASGDPDSDGLTNLQEYTYSTDPNDSDSDDDGLSDYAEINNYAGSSIQSLVASDGDSDDRFGYSVSVSGDYMILGAYLDEPNGSNSGSAYIFKNIDGTWTQYQKLTASDSAAEDRFGEAVAIDGDYAVIGCFADDDNGSTSGSAYIFKNVNGTWTQYQKLTASDGNANDYFGYSVAIKGDYVIIGAYQDGDNYGSAGSAYVFKNESGTWTQKSKLVASDNYSSDCFGYSVGISENYAIVGSLFDDDNGTDSGSAYIFYNNNDSWTQLQKITASDGAASDRFGASVTISGDYIAVGAYNDESSKGAVYVFKNNSGTWSQETKITASDGVAGDKFGASVFLNNDSLAVAANAKNSGAGEAYLYSHDTNGWTEAILNVSSTAGDSCGYDSKGISVDGNTVVIGGAYNNSSQGKAYVATILDGTDPNDSDSDDDGMPDGWEVQYGLNPLVNDASGDADSDGLANLQEYTNSTDPTDSDSDDDGLSDYAEINTYNTNPKKADTDEDGLSDGYEVNTSLTDPNDSDSDDDGILDGEEDNDSDGFTNSEEEAYGTDSNDTDTDGDGISDYVEIKEMLTDATSADIGTLSNLLTLNGSVESDSEGGWTDEGTVIYADDRNGWLEYTLNITTAGVYRLGISGTQRISTSIQDEFTLKVYIDGAYCNTKKLVAAYGTVGTVYFYLPELSAANHTLKIVWANIESDTKLQINSISLDTYSGPDSDSNGNADWIDNRLANLSDDLTVPSSSKTSPLCIEGANAYYIEGISISGYYTPSGETPVDPVIKRAPSDKWYADVPLDPSATTNLGISFQDGANTVQKTVTWEATNVLTDVSYVEIRQNDSLLLTAYPEGATSGSISISVEEETYTPTIGAPVAHKFENTGDITVSATYTPAVGEAETRSITVHVCSASFNGTPICALGSWRTWDNSGICDEAVLEYDSTLTVTESDLDPGRRINILTNVDEDAYMIARLGKDGPIMDSVAPSIVDYTTHKSEGYYKLLETYADGSMLIEGYIYLSEVPDDISIRLTIYASGITFDDGTIEKTLTAVDFDENGVARYQLIKPEGAITATCHHIRIYQGTEYLNTIDNY
jgi:hypothetical protein